MNKEAVASPGSEECDFWALLQAVNPPNLSCLL